MASLGAVLRQLLLPFAPPILNHYTYTYIIPPPWLFPSLNKLIPSSLAPDILASHCIGKAMSKAEPVDSSCPTSFTSLHYTSAILLGLCPPVSISSDMAQQCARHAYCIACRYQEGGTVAVLGQLGVPPSELCRTKLHNNRKLTAAPNSQYSLQIQFWVIFRFEWEFERCNHQNTSTTNLIKIQLGP